LDLYGGWLEEEVADDVAGYARDVLCRHGKKSVIGLQSTSALFSAGPTTSQQERFPAVTTSSLMPGDIR